MAKKYILDKGIPREVHDVEEWAEWIETEDRRIDYTELFDGTVKVSTVFLGLDHSFDPDGPPLIFETMVFGGDMDETTMRHTKLGDAKSGHWRMVDLVLSKGGPHPLKNEEPHSDSNEEPHSDSAED